MSAWKPGRRTALAAGLSLPLWGCTLHDSAAPYSGGWVGADAQRGHRLRDLKSGSLPAPALQRRAGALVVGAGISGLAAARALRQSGIDDVQVFDLEDTAGGNSRGHVLGGMACPLGAHYLPVPGERAVEVIALLEELGLRSTEHGQPVYDERHLCHSPQERLFIGGYWHEGLLPPLEALPAGQRASTLAQYAQFSAAVRQLSEGAAFSIPTARSSWRLALDALDAVPFAQWLDTQGLNAPALRWYLDYCCRDDYGAGAAQVSAWAGIHYFASRHGFHAPGESNEEREGVLTWPEGNAWLSRRLAASLGERLRSGCIALRVSEDRFDASLDVWNVRSSQAERWTAPQLVLAVPLFIAARLLDAPPAALTQAVASMRHAPWLVANLELAQALDDRPGAPPSWDNVVYAAAASGSAALGYVDAMHQSTRPYPGPTVLTAYWALGGDSAAQLQVQRARLLNEAWATWAQAVVADLARVHPDLPGKLKQVDLMRYGHAMSIPVPGLRSSTALRALAEPQRRVQFAHADLSSYSVFEEAIYQGQRAGLAAKRAMSR
ncbi:MAG: FAD-dependent oxidoreductase [Burkholderiales bacterium]